MAELNMVMFVVLWAVVSATIHWDTNLINSSTPFVNGTEIELPPNKTYLNMFCPPGTGNITVQCLDEKKEPFTNRHVDPVNHYVATCDPLNGLVCNPDAKVNATSNATCPDFALQYGCDRPDSGSTNNTQTKPTTSSKGGNGNAVSLTHGTVVPTKSTLPPPSGGRTPVPSENGIEMSTAHGTGLSNGSIQSNTPPGGSMGSRCTCNGGNHAVINKTLVSLIIIFCLIKRLVN